VQALWDIRCFWSFSLVECTLKALVAYSGYNYSVWSCYILHQNMKMETVSEMLGERSIFIWLITR